MPPFSRIFYYKLTFCSLSLFWGRAGEGVHNGCIGIKIPDNYQGRGSQQMLRIQFPGNCRGTEKGKEESGSGTKKDPAYLDPAHPRGGSFGNKENDLAV